MTSLSLHERAPLGTFNAPPPSIDTLTGRTPDQVDPLGVRLTAHNNPRAAAVAWLYVGSAPEASEGDRNEIAHQVAAQLYRFGVPPETCRELLAEWNENFCSSPLRDDVISSIVDSAAPVAAVAVKISTAADPSSPRLAAALDHVRRGFRVFPLAHNAKKPPLFNKFTEFASRDEAILRGWFDKPHAPNIGIATDTMLVVDVDPRNGGTDTLKVLTLTEEFPPTLGAKTAGGGCHMFYRLPAGLKVKGGTHKLGQGIDVKAKGNYVVGAGSDIDGNFYQWLNDAPIADAPDWMRAKLEQAAVPKPNAGKPLGPETPEGIALAEKYIRERAPEATQGNRDDTAYNVAAAIYDYVVEKQTAHILLAEWNETKCSEPLDDDAIARIADSAGRNRENPKGCRDPNNACGFEPVEIDESKKPKKPSDDAVAPLDGATDFLENYAAAAAKALTESGDPLVDGVIDRGTFSTWYGPPKSGKTFIVLWLCLCIASGHPWANRKTRRGAVVYLAAEGGRGIYKRLRALQLQHPELDGSPLFVIRKQVDLLHGKAGVEFLAAQCKVAAERAGVPVELIVIDTVARALSGGDENSPTDMGGFVKNCDALRDMTQAHVLGVHHTPKANPSMARGHGSLLGAVDTEIQILANRITSSNQRDLNDDLSLHFSLKTVQIGTTMAGDRVTSCVIEMEKGTPQPAEMTKLQKENYDKIIKAEAAYIERLAEKDNLPPGSGDGFTFGWDVLVDDTIAAELASSASKREDARKLYTKRLATLRDLGQIKYLSDNTYTLIASGSRPGATL
jgi:AAA domain/Bifunctional DNA primase/polymerase, N-terminal/Primase C terminal 1 (PriCT-1)